MEPLPYIFSIWAMAVSMARFLSEAGAAEGTGAFSFAIVFFLLYVHVPYLRLYPWQFLL